MSHTLEERCRQLMIQRKFEQCQKEIETAMAENPHCAIPHNLMWILLEKESNHVLVMKHFRAAYALDPTYVPARYNMEQYAQMYPTGKCCHSMDWQMPLVYQGNQLPGMRQEKGALQLKFWIFIRIILM